MSPDRGHINSPLLHKMLFLFSFTLPPRIVMRTRTAAAPPNPGGRLIPLLPHRFPTGHQPPSMLYVAPGRVVAGGGSGLPLAHNSDGPRAVGTYAGDPLPGRRPRPPAAGARAPTAVPTACQPRFPTPSRPDRTVTLGTRARIRQRTHYTKAPSRGSHATSTYRRGPGRTPGFGGKTLGARLRVHTRREPCFVGVVF